MEIISSSNAKIKKIVHLRKSSYRKKTGLSVIDGCAEIVRAFEYEQSILEVFICQELLPRQSLDLILNLAKNVGAKIFFITENIFDKISFGDRKEGIVAVFAPKTLELSDLESKKSSLFLVLENIEKPGNIGAILRTGDCVGIDGIILTEVKTDISNSNVIRASLGTIFSVKTVCCSNEEAFNFLKSRNINICAADPDAKSLYSDIDFSLSTAIVLGAEHEGLSNFWKNKANNLVRIPMKGCADSLNVSASGAIIVYEAIRQRGVS